MDLSAGIIINENVKSEGFNYLLKKLWPSFLIYNSFAITLSTIFINFLIFSNIMWPGDPFHSSEMGVLVGTSSYMMAISGIIFGVLADRVSRIKLMSISEIIFGISFLLNGFIPGGKGFESYLYFLILNIIRGFASGGFWPLLNSYANDSTEEKQRSQFFGILQALFQLFQIIGMVISAIIFQNYFWREYFWVSGGLFCIFGFIIILKAKEPKRGSTHDALKGILADENIKYEYKLNKETIRATIVAPTNIIAFIEGIFTTILLMVPDFLFVPYIQSPPFNISPFITSLFMIIFGLPGGLIGSLVFAKLSDKLAKKNIKNRVYMIVISISTIFTFYIILFFLPLPNLTKKEGNNLFLIFTHPVPWIMGILALISRSVLGLWNINQPPILQAINLPEAQGTISSANQFLEAIGTGTGPIIAGSLLLFFNQNYQITVSITMGLGMVGGLLWLLASVWINRDVERISKILKQRGIELSKNNSKTLP